VFSIIFQPISKVFRLSTHISSRVFFLPSFGMRTRCHFCRLPLATSRLLLFFFFSPLTGVFAREDVIENFAAKRRLAAVWEARGADVARVNDDKCQGGTGRHVGKFFTITRQWMERKMCLSSGG
jgi:hypothetical protein